MCKKYLVITKDGQKQSADDLNEAFKLGDEAVTELDSEVYIYERISTGKPKMQVSWEGRRRPGAGT